MPEHLRSLIVILGLATVTMLVAKKPSRPLMLADGDFERRRNLWFGITLAAFLAHNFWIFILIAGVLLIRTSLQERDKIGMALFVLLTVPVFDAEIPGFGLIRYLMNFHYLRLISIVVFLPILIREIKKHSFQRFTNEAPDKFLYLYLILNIGLTFASSTFTVTGRAAVYAFIDIIVPYAVASRLTNTVGALRSAMAAYVLGASIMAVIGVFEYVKRWLLYDALDSALGVQWGLGSYLLRGDSLRAVATAGQGIPFGLSMGVAFCLMLSLGHFFQRKFFWIIGLSVLALGLFSSVSRGPWLGTAIGLLAYFLTDRQKSRAVTYLCLGGVLLAIAAVATPLGEKMLFYMTVEDTLTYRRRLLDISTDLIFQYPFFGPPNYLQAPSMQQLIQGQGIIDIVNTYLAVALNSGLVGLSLFVSFFGSAMFLLWRRMALAAKHDPDLHELGRGLLAAIVCTLVTIFTVSSISVIPWIYYLVAGLAVGYARMEHAQTEAFVPAHRPIFIVPH